MADTDVGSGEGRVSLVRGVLREVDEELAHHGPAQEEGGAGIEDGRHQGEGHVLHRNIKYFQQNISLKYFQLNMLFLD